MPVPNSAAVPEFFPPGCTISSSQFPILKLFKHSLPRKSISCASRNCEKNFNDDSNSHGCIASRKKSQKKLSYGSFPFLPHKISSLLRISFDDVHKIFISATLKQKERKESIKGNIKIRFINIFPISHARSRLEGAREAERTSCANVSLWLIRQKTIKIESYQRNIFSSIICITI